MLYWVSTAFLTLFVIFHKNGSHRFTKIVLMFKTLHFMEITLKQYLTLNKEVPRKSWNCSPWNDEKLSKPWSYQKILNIQFLDFKSSKTDSRLHEDYKTWWWGGRNSLYQRISSEYIITNLSFVNILKLLKLNTTTLPKKRESFWLLLFVRIFIWVTANCMCKKYYNLFMQYFNLPKIISQQFHICLSFQTI